MTNSKPIEPLQMSSLFVAFLGFITPFSLVLGLLPRCRAAVDRAVLIPFARHPISNGIVRTQSVWSSSTPFTRPN